MPFVRAILQFVFVLFSGIMFPVKCKDLLPLDHLVIKSVAVRGYLGPLTVWVSNDDYEQQRQGDRSVERRVRLNPAFWTKLSDKTHERSCREYKQLVLENPIKLKPGETRVIYIHSTLPGDRAIVYDNSYYGMESNRYEDDKLLIMTGRAHVSTEVFGQEPIWGWGNAWRDRREFVGRLEYGTVYKLWNPQVQPKFGGKFQDGARSLFMCQRRWESPWSLLPDECIFFILNMCRWDWFDDDFESMKQRRKREKLRARLDREEAAATATASMDESGTTDDNQMEEGSEEEEEEEEEDEEEEDEDDEDFALEEDDDEDDDEDGDSDDAWSDDGDQYHRANVQSFSYRDVDSDEEDADDSEGEVAAGRPAQREWIRRQYARIHVLRALAQMEDGAIGNVQF